MDVWVWVCRGRGRVEGDAGEGRVLRFTDNIIHLFNAFFLYLNLTVFIIKSHSCSNEKHL